MVMGEFLFGFAIGALVTLGTVAIVAGLLFPVWFRWGRLPQSFAVQEGQLQSQSTQPAVPVPARMSLLDRLTTARPDNEKALKYSTVKAWDEAETRAFRGKDRFGGE